MLVSGGKVVATASGSTNEMSYSVRDAEQSCDVYALLRGGWSDYSAKAVSAKAKLSASKVTGTKLVATGRVRVNFSRVKGADGYIIYRRTGSSSHWSKVAAVTGEKQLYCYDNKAKARTTYHYTVKAYVSRSGKKAYASYNKSGTKAYYSSVTVNPKSAKDTSVYGPKLSSRKISQVKAAVKSFCTKYITSDMSTVEKLMTAQLYMAATCTYAATWTKNDANTAWGSLVYKNSRGIHEAQCSGYARGYKALCDGMGISCRYVHASSESHQWVQVKVSGKWYIIDPTCNTADNFWMFLICGKTYSAKWGREMKWNKSSLPAVSGTDYSWDKIEAAYNGYKMQLIKKKLFGDKYLSIRH